MDLRSTSCIIIFTLCLCIIQTSQLPLKNNRLTPVINVFDNNYARTFNYYPPLLRHPEAMKPSASSYFTPNVEEVEHVEYSDYESETIAPALENFESVKIIKKPSEIKKSTEIVSSTSSSSLELFNTSTHTYPHISANPEMADISTQNANNYSKLLFSSPSATVTSNGPSGPFKAIICHDCENSGGVNNGHFSVSFSAIKSWNVGSSNAMPKSSLNDSALQLSETSESAAAAAAQGDHHDAIVLEQTSSTTTTSSITYNDDDGGYKSAEKNVDDENQGSSFESQVTVNDSELPAKKSLSNNNKEWDYSLLTVRNENIKLNDPPTTATTTTTTTSTKASSIASSPLSLSGMHKKPIFNDLLKVPYDVLNAPRNEPAPPEPITRTQIHINHQQKINDTITNYHHFQQFIQKSPQEQTAPSYYQSTAMPEQNYEVDESVSLMTNGRAHGVQSTTPKAEKSIQPTIHAHVNVEGQDAKFGVVYEGRDFRKYKVEEKTSDGFIVGEYGYLSNTDGSPLFGVRYTADSNINPQLIYDALLKFIKL